MSTIHDHDDLLKTKLSANFSLYELCRSEAADRAGIDNVPGPEIIARLKDVCANILEPVRKHYQKPVRVNSGYRSPQANAAVGGSRTSQHVQGYAVDFEIAGVDNLELAHWCAANLEFDQIISEFYLAGQPESGWVHCSWKPTDRRGQKLTINKAGTKPGLPPLPTKTSA